MKTESNALFSYGTLQLARVQRANYGRLLAGEPDALIGFALRPIAIEDPAVIAASGCAVHTIAFETGNPEDRIEGTLFELSEDEMEATDRYESGPYARIGVALVSGRRAWIYASLQRE